MNPTMTIAANFYEPLYRTSFNKTFKITFPEMPLQKALTSTSYNVKTTVNQPTSSFFLIPPDPSTIKRVNNWFDGTVTITDHPQKDLNNQESGYYYEGYFPSPNQVADYIAYAHGWELNYVYAAQRFYEFNSSMKPVTTIWEEIIPNMSINSSYNLVQGQSLTVQQAPALTKELNATYSKNTVNQKVSIYTHIHELNATSKVFGIDDALLWGFILGVCFSFAWTYCVMGWKYDANDLADYYDKGYWIGVNDSIDAYNARLYHLLLTAQIDNTTYQLLLLQWQGAYSDLLKAYSNPYRNGIPPANGNNDWVHTLIDVITQAVIWVIVIIVIVIVIWAIRKTGLLSSHKTDNVNLNIRGVQCLGENTGTLCTC